MNQVRWVPNSHYSGIFTMVKIVFPEILPKDLKQVVVLDSDLTFLCDVAELWSMFRYMSDYQFIGLVENESHWYFGPKRWPALGRGYNTGIMLLDLEKLRANVNWRTLWTNAVNENIDELKVVMLADQDIVNAIIRKNPSIVYNIDCLYNVQLSTNTLAKNCYGNDKNNIKILHWNNPSKYNIKTEDAEYFRNIHQSYVNFDGNLLRKFLHRCAQTEVVTYKMRYNPDAICETIHLALICMGKCLRTDFVPMLKSLLHHRQNPLHFHFVVDPSSQLTISKLFDTWDLPDVKYTCYAAQKYMNQVRWVPNSHYTGIFSMVKIVFPEILPKDLKKVVVLDSDLTFLCDVAELWSMFRYMSDYQFIGLVENESHWYFEPKRWPALGRGYNTGIMLLDLEKLRANVNWRTLWTNAVNENIDELKGDADQDIVNAIIRKNPSIVYNIDCHYNVQLSSKTLAKNCYGNDKKNIKILHWNNPGKYNIKTEDAEYFRNIHQSYVNFDGNLLREMLHRCAQTEVVTCKMNHSDHCLSFRAAQRIKLRTHLYYMDYSHTVVDDFDVTLVLQLSMDRLQFLETLVKHWEGPLSAAIYLSDCEVKKFESFIRDRWDSLSSRQNIGYHLVFKQDLVHYPVNYLRNVALENVNTPYVFLMDADFVPMSSLYAHLRASIILINPYPQKKCLVIPAFEMQRYRASPPRHKAALVARLRNSSNVAPFRALEWPRGHRATNYSRWATATAPYEVEWQSDFEPYLVVHRTVPKYDTRFSGFGWNKVSHSVELRAQGYRPVVLPDAFVVHTPHAPSRDITAFRADPHYRICLAMLKQEFMEDLKRKYNVTFDEPSKPEPYMNQAKESITKSSQRF